MNDDDRTWLIPPDCPAACGPLRWLEDAWYCPRCGDEWDDDSMRALDDHVVFLDES